MGPWDAVHVVSQISNFCLIVGSVIRSFLALVVAEITRDRERCSDNSGFRDHTFILSAQAMLSAVGQIRTPGYFMENFLEQNLLGHVILLPFFLQ